MMRFVFWVNEINMLITASNDNVLRFWDPKNNSNQPAHSINLPQKPLAMDVKFPVLVVCTSFVKSPQDRHIQVYNLQNLSNLVPQINLTDNNSLLKMQYRAVSVCTDKTCFAVGGIEGRVSFYYLDRSKASKDFAFKCHREKDKSVNNIYAVNDIAFHPKFNTFATVGGDGIYNFWDKDDRRRLQYGKPVTHMVENKETPISITSCGFNSSGDLFAYSLGYDWSKGPKFNQNPKNYILVHSNNIVNTMTPGNK
eukprot:augustus_masked-scaffold_4-processed-gene-5.5-mRNA-1 protein AED:0.35 eAED:0.35 QI:0/-1/0/1/-1/1/1/0/252